MKNINLSYVWLFILVSFSYLLFNYGFMQVRFPYGQGFGIPIGEWTLLIGLILVRYKYLEVKIFYIFLFWWLYTAILLVYSVSTHGFWALRDASHVIESLFILIGFHFVSYYKYHSILIFIRLFKLLAVLLVLYAFLYTIKDQISNISPFITTGAGYEVFLFFHYLNTPYLLLVVAMSLIILCNYDRNIIHSIFFFIISIFILLIDIMLFPSRTLYLQIIFAMLFLVGISKKFILNFIILFGLVLSLLSISNFLGIELQSRTGVTVNAEYILNHFMSLSGKGEGTVSGSAEGVGLRLTWWIDIFNRLIDSIPALFFGLGYGIPLVDFIAVGAKYAEGGQVVREPHNSYISIIARSGVIGFLVWSAIQIYLISIWRKVAKVFPNNSIEKYFLNIVMIYSICLWVLAIGEDSFEKPYNTIIYYFLWGMVIGLSILVKRKKYSNNYSIYMAENYK